MDLEHEKGDSSENYQKIIPYEERVYDKLEIRNTEEVIYQNIPEIINNHS